MKVRNSVETTKVGLDVSVLPEVSDGIVDWVWRWNLLLGWDNPLVIESLLSSGGVLKAISDFVVLSKVWHGVVFEWILLKVLGGHNPISLLQLFSDVKTVKVGIHFGILTKAGNWIVHWVGFCNI